MKKAKTRRENLIGYLENIIISNNPCLATIIEIKDTPLTMKVIGEYGIFHFAKTTDYYIINLIYDRFVMNTDTLRRAERYLEKHQH